TREPVDSLSMGDEHLDTIPATESDEFIKLSKKIYSNPLFDEEIIPIKIDQHPFNAESDLIESMPNHDSSITISSKIDSLFDEFAGELTLLKSIPSGINETDCHHEKETRFAKRLLYDNSSPRPSEEIVSDNSNADIESFSPSPIPNKDSDSHMEEIDLLFTPDDPMTPGIEDDYDSGRDIPILKELLNNYSLSLPANESYHFDILSPYRPPAKPLDGNTGTLNIKMMGDVSDQKVPIPGLTINGKNIPLLDVPIFHFYPLDQLKENDVDLLERCKQAFRDESDTGNKKFTEENVWCILRKRARLDAYELVNLDDVVGYAELFDDDVRPHPPTNLGLKNEIGYHIELHGKSHYRKFTGENDVDLLDRCKQAFRDESDTGTKKFTQEHVWRVLRKRARLDAYEPVNLDDVVGYAELFEVDVRPHSLTNLGLKKMKSGTTSSFTGSHSQDYQMFYKPNFEANKKLWNRCTR
nr:hypothetical protein [Tanacetum cinerariifolium]